MSFQRVFASCALILASFLPARAATSYNSQAALEASVPGLTYSTVNLSSLIGICAPCSSITDPVTGAVFTMPSALMSVTNSTTIHQGGGGTITVTLPANIVAFGAQMNPNGGTFVDVGFTGGDSGGLVLPAFFGARASTGGFITLVTYGVGPGAMDLVSFEVGTSASSSTPETGTLVSLGGGLLLLGAIRRRMMRGAA